MERYIFVEGSIETERFLELFKIRVNERVKEGYVPVGSPITSGTWIYQAMIISAKNLRDRKTILSLLGKSDPSVVSHVA